jgi:hypothetical protein
LKTIYILDLYLPSSIENVFGSSEKNKERERGSATIEMMNESSEFNGCGAAAAAGGVANGAEI